MKERGARNEFSLSSLTDVIGFTLHRVCFTRAGLTVGKDAHLIDDLEAGILMRKKAIRPNLAY